MTPFEIDARETGILDAIARDEWFRSICGRFDVTMAAVAALAFEPTIHGLCRGCGGNGREGERKDKPTRCDRCKGTGHCLTTRCVTS